MKLLFGILFILHSVAVTPVDSATLTVEFEITKYSKGKIYVALYNSEDSFLKKPIKGTIVTVENGKATATFEDVAAGTYAISSFYDKNGNGKLDTNFLGIPKEPTAMSNNAKGSFGPPKFKDAKFAMNTNTTIQIAY